MYVYIYIYIFTLHIQYKHPSSLPHLVFDPLLTVLPFSYISLYSKHITTVYAPLLSTECVNGMLLVSIAPPSVNYPY